MKRVFCCCLFLLTTFQLVSMHQEKSDDWVYCVDTPIRLEEISDEQTDLATKQPPDAGHFLRDVAAHAAGALTVALVLGGAKKLYDVIAAKVESQHEKKASGESDDEYLEVEEFAPWRKNIKKLTVQPHYHEVVKKVCEHPQSDPFVLLDNTEFIKSLSDEHKQTLVGCLDDYAADLFSTTLASLVTHEQMAFLKEISDAPEKITGTAFLAHFTDEQKKEILKLHERMVSYYNILTSVVVER